MLKILYDSQIFKIQQFGGISRYYAELLKGVNNTPGFKTIPQRFFSANKHLRFNSLTYLDRFRDDFSFRGKSRIEQFIVEREHKKFSKTLRGGNFDIFHPTYYNAASIDGLPANKPFVLTVYDMIHELYYDSYYNKEHQETRNKRMLIPKATHIVAISQSTKNDILRFFPEIDEKKITVIYLGSSFSVDHKETVMDLPKKYILFVGHRDHYKNFAWFFQAAAAYLKQSDLTLICAGGIPFESAELDMIASAGLSGKVLHISINNDNDLVALYRRASCFIFPSLFEGFGIPILEAFSCSCPVLLPDSTCFPEIAGEAALYYEPGNPLSLAAQLERIVNDAQLSKQLSEAGLQRLKLFNWQKTAMEHIRMYEMVAAGN